MGFGEITRKLTFLSIILYESLLAPEVRITNEPFMPTEDFPTEIQNSFTVSPWLKVRLEG